MLDANIDKIFSIEPSLNQKVEKISKSLLLRTCKIYMCDDARLDSQFENMTFDMFNGNSGYGLLDIEFVFENNIVKDCYPRFYTKCFSIRTDTDVYIKQMKYKSNPNESKVDQNGDLVIGIRYFFDDEQQMEKIKECNNLLVEGFIALGKPNNVYGIMCQLRKGKRKWKILSAYTYKPKYADNIKWLFD